MALKNNHAAVRELLAARLDRPLTRAESRVVTTHLKACVTCQRIDAEYRAHRQLLRALPAPVPPRDMWARTSAALDREVARGGARTAWGRRMKRARRRAQPSSALVSTVAAVVVVTAVAALQLGPQTTPAPSDVRAPTPFAVEPQPLAFVGLGGTDLAIYRMTVSEVCPQSATLDCVPPHKIVRTPIGLSLPRDLQPDNVALSPTGERLVLVGKQRDSDVIAVVMMPTEDGSVVNPTESVDLPESTETPEVAPPTDLPTPEPTAPPTVAATPAASPDPSGGVPASAAPEDPSQMPSPSTSPDEPESPTPEPTDAPTPRPTQTPEPVPSGPPESAVPGLAVVSILEDVRSAGAPPAWSRNGSMLAFSAMPVDRSHGPDVYVWSPGDEHARPITTDHGSYFASWSGNRVVVSRISLRGDGSAFERNYVIDPSSLEERRVRGGPMWLPAVNAQRTRAVVWRGDLGADDDQPELRSGSLFLMDWRPVDPFGELAAEGSNAQPRLIPLEPGRDPDSAPVADWQAGWSRDGRVLAVWIADSAGSSWGLLTVMAIDPETGHVAEGEPLLPATLARRGFSLANDRVAWVAASDDNVDGELRVRAWTSDGVGGVRVVSPEQEEVLPAF